MQTAEAPTVLTVAEVARRLRISRVSAYRLCRDRGFPAARVRGQIRIPAAAFERWLADQTASEVP